MSVRYKYTYYIPVTENIMHQDSAIERPKKFTSDFHQ